MLSNIAAQLDITLPALYLRLEADGMLDWGELGPHWYEQVYPIKRQHPPLLLFADDFRIVPPARMAEQAARLQLATVGYRCALPFGRNGAGDLYCLLYANAAGPDCVAQINKAGGEGRVLTATLADFIFRQLLGAVVQMDEAALDDVAGYLADLRAMLTSHRPYLPPAQAAVLLDVYARPLQEDKDGLPGLIGVDEYQALLREHTASLPARAFNVNINA